LHETADAGDATTTSTPAARAIAVRMVAIRRRAGARDIAANARGFPMIIDFLHMSGS
jgi:hypothetical protein